MRQEGDERGKSITIKNRRPKGIKNNQVVSLLLSHPDATYQEIGNLIGCTKQRVHQIAKRAGLKRDKKPRNYRSDITVERVLKLYRDNLLVKDIAETLGCNQLTVSRRLRAAGISKGECRSQGQKIRHNKHWSGLPIGI